MSDRSGRLDDIFEGGEGRQTQTLRRGGASARRGRGAQRSSADRSAERQAEESAGAAADPREEFVLPSGEELEAWLVRAFEAERAPKVRSGFHISVEHGRKAEQIRDHLTYGMGFGRRDASLANVVETSLDLLHELLIGGEARDGQDG